MRKALAGVRWYVGELLGEITGDNAYRRYCERARQQDPGAQVLDRGAFERRRAEERGARPNGGARCC
ncbi:CstA-like transporter-associated (seleno)protein [Streptomyces bohaiensis]|uniref:YbdD/YjiX family protein n=1 Tax=Streptomyces bohaiensis TaxID=1431344 RepID=A0ABX1CC01_9ACTN|nr:CstA-like transporter-associated (seleno)protein [Streptomyces bohaiensis]NJQ16635.1 YbdD/YjiX family protein [Streptomyces bohaiensis]